MFGFVKQVFVVAMTLFSFNVLNLMNINNNEPVFYPFSIKVNKCSASCNDINNTYAKFCVPDVAKNINVKVFNLMSFSNQTRHIEWYETCKCKCRLDSNVCNNKQKWNEDKCRCECREELSNGVIKDLFGILVIVILNVIIHVT